MHAENNNAIQGVPKIISKGRSGILFFIIIYFLAIIISLTKFHGSSLVINVAFRFILTLILCICIYFLDKYPIEALSVSMLICGLDTLRSIYLRLLYVLNYGGVKKILTLIIGGGIRLIALWIILSALIGIKKIKRNQEEASEI